MLGEMCKHFFIFKILHSDKSSIFYLSLHKVSLDKSEVSASVIVFTLHDIPARAERGFRVG